MDQEIINPKSTATDWMLCPTPTPAVRSPFTPQCPKCTCGNKASTFTEPSLLFISILFYCIGALIQSGLITQLNLKKSGTLLIMHMSVRGFGNYVCQFTASLKCNILFTKNLKPTKLHQTCLRSFGKVSVPQSCLFYEPIMFHSFFNLQISYTHKGYVCVSLWAFAICKLIACGLF